jgi:hypothetical protein
MADSSSSITTATSSFDSLTNTQSQALQNFLTHQCARDAFTHAKNKFLDCHKDFVKAKGKLEKLKSRNKPGQDFSLPHSLKVKIIANLQLPIVSEDTSFYKEQIDILRKIERDTEKTIFDQIIIARTKHIEYLSKQMNPLSFTSNEVIGFTRIVNDWGDRHDSIYQITTSSTDLLMIHENVFPRKEAIAQFNKDLAKFVNDHISLQIQQSITLEAREKQNAMDNTAAQATMLEGAHTGRTIKDLSKQTTEEAMGPIRKRIRQLEAVAVLTRAVTKNHKLRHCVATT